MNPNPIPYLYPLDPAYTEEKCTKGLQEYQDELEDYLNLYPANEISRDENRAFGIVVMRSFPPPNARQLQIESELKELYRQPFEGRLPRTFISDALDNTPVFPAIAANSTRLMARIVENSKIRTRFLEMMLRQKIQKETDFIYEQNRLMAQARTLNSAGRNNQLGRIPLSLSSNINSFLGQKRKLRKRNSRKRNSRKCKK